MALTVKFSVITLCLLAEVGHAQSGLRAGSRLNEEKVSAEYLEMSLLSELSGALGHGGSEHRLLSLEGQLGPMYASLPKNPEGRLDHSVVRFALHRFFVQRHGWYVKGLEPTGDAWNSSSPTEVLKERVPSYVLDLLEHRLDNRGLGLRELAVLAATLEDLVHSEAIERLSAAYSANQISTTGRLTDSQMKLVISTYMMFFILPVGDYSNMRPQEVKAKLKIAPKVYPGWEDTLLWVHDVRQSLEYTERAQKNAFVEKARDFSSTAHVVEQVGEQFGRFQDLECRSLKEALLQKEHQGSGRVRLSNFYAQALDGDWQFSESVDYLRHLGALDETDPGQPSVVIPNYISSRTNCLALSSFYSVCCIDECEALMGSLERHITAPEASPQHIAKLVAAMPSDTVDAPRNLSAPLLKRLDDIAAHHGGSVPLHGRLFAQWMHHAYPRECPYPHVAGAVDAPRTPDEWMLESGSNASSVSSEEEMRSFVASSPATNYTEDDANSEEPAALPWSAEEELVMIKRPARVDTSALSASNILRTGAFVVACGSLVLSMFRTSKSTLDELPLFDGAAKRSTSSWFSSGFSRASKAHYV